METLGSFLCGLTIGALLIIVFNKPKSTVTTTRIIHHPPDDLFLNPQYDQDAAPELVTAVTGELETELWRAIVNENYELAAELRDKIDRKYGFR